jgi:hypothetical protein
MIKHMGWYLGEKRFSNLCKELTLRVEAYRDAKASGESEGEQGALREAARELFEAESVASGLREQEDSYINIDAEFFADGVLDEESLGKYVKNIIKGHCYQKQLWEYMGTTGSFTVISKAEMRNQGRKYEDYLPIGYHEPAAMSRQLPENTVGIYLYSDGSVSGEYDEERAKYRFDVLKDTSGIDWQKGYDPNDEVKKEGWHAGFDETGTWVKVKEGSRAGEGGIRKQKRAEIELIAYGDGVILYDPGMVLLRADDLLYLTESGEAYGELEADIEGTVEAIRRELDAMGGKQISWVGNGRRGDEGILIAYQAVLQDLADPEMQLLEREAIAEVKGKEKERRRKEAEESVGVEVERRIRYVSVEQKGNDVREAFSSGMVRVSLDVLNGKDGEALGLGAEEIAVITKEKVREEEEGGYGNTLSNLYAGWGAYEGSGRERWCRSGKKDTVCFCSTPRE